MNRRLLLEFLKHDLKVELKSCLIFVENILEDLYISNEEDIKSKLIILQDEFNKLSNDIKQFV